MRQTSSCIVPKHCDHYTDGCKQEPDSKSLTIHEPFEACVSIDELVVKDHAHQAHEEERKSCKLYDAKCFGYNPSALFGSRCRCLVNDIGVVLACH